MLDKNQTVRIVDFAKAYPVISAIYLFGSHASGHERSRSDIDLGVLFNEDVAGFKRIDMETDISNRAVLMSLLSLAVILRLIAITRPPQVPQ